VNDSSDAPRTAGAWALALFALAACAPADPPGESAMKKTPPPIECAGCKTPAVPETPLPATEEEWKQKLTPAQFYILRRRGTEPPYSGAYLHHKEDGIYACAGCGQPLYDSRTKYDSCGWPSFWDALPGAVATRDDGSGAPEAICSRCKGHLGHIFDDGPPPTGKRH
jgi:peptide-methionine (R)-S-oxide reductase